MDHIEALTKIEKMLTESAIDPPELKQLQGLLRVLKTLETPSLKWIKK